MNNAVLKENSNKEAETQLKARLATVTYEDIHQDILNYIKSREEISEVLSTSLINTFVACQASVTAGLASAVQVATQEAYLDTAYQEKNILANAMNLGAFIKRKDPAYVTVQIVNKSANKITVPRFSVFSVGSYKLFNKEQFELPSTLSVELKLYEGEEQTEEFVATGESYEVFYLSKVGNFQISTEDIYVIETDSAGEKIEYTCTQEPLFSTGSTGEYVMQQKTLPSGYVILKTGNGTYGAKPSQGSTIEVHYIKTQGESASLALQEGTEITANIEGLIVTAKSSLQNGGDELSEEFYQNYAPAIYSSTVIGGCATLEQLQQYALQFNGIIADCKLLGQRSTFPNNLRYLNVIQASILTHKGIITDDEWAQFVEYMKQKSTFEYVRVDPVGVAIDVEVNIVVSKTTDPEIAKVNIIDAFNQYFELKIGSIGKSFYKSDISKILRSVLGAYELSRYSIVFPATDKEITNSQYLKLNSLNITVTKEDK